MNRSRPKAFVVEVAGKVAHLAFEIVALVNDVPGEVFFAVPLSDVAVLETIEFFAAPVDEIKCKVSAMLRLHEHCRAATLIMQSFHSVRRLLIAQV